MCKMSTGVVALFVVGLVGPGCSDLPGLNSPVGGAGGGDGAKGGQAGSAVGSGTAGGSGGRIGAGGVGAGGPGGTTRTGGAIGTGGATATGGTIGTGGCPPGACPTMACLYGYLPSPDPCGCSGCAPPPDAGVAKDSGSQDGGVCLALPLRPADLPWRIRDESRSLRLSRLRHGRWNGDGRGKEGRGADLSANQLSHAGLHGWIRGEPRSLWLSHLRAS
jgi:hypothetical protein